MALRGVNLGGWLMLEKWITPSLFRGTKAQDEVSFSALDASSGYKKIKTHRLDFITQKDFAWLARAQFDAIRLPVGYWALEDDNPYLNCQTQVDKAFEWAQEFGLKVLLDLHGAPGSQNGNDHSGRVGAIEWPKAENIERTLGTLAKLAARYGKQPALWGISLLNEPGWDVSLDVLRQFYINGYKTVRQYCDESIAVVISDAFRPTEWNGFMTGPDFKNVHLDMHLYQCFSAADKALDTAGHLDKTKHGWSNIIAAADKPVLVGEWSLSLGQSETDRALKAYADAQLGVFGSAAGWFFWTYKTEDESAWNLRYLVDAGLLEPRKS